MLAVKARVNEVRALADGVSARQPAWEGLFKELSALAPRGVLFNDMQFDRRVWSDGRGSAPDYWRRTLEIQATISPKRGSPARILDALLSNLRRSGFFKKIVLQPIDGRPDGGRRGKEKDVLFVSVKCTMSDRRLVSPDTRVPSADQPEKH